MYEDFKRNKKIIESTYGSIENYTKMQSNIASMTQHIMPLHSTDELFNIGRLMSERL